MQKSPRNNLPEFLVLQAQAQDETEDRAALEAELKELEEQIAKYEEDITKTAQQKQTLANQISVLKKKISQLNLQISQSNVMIKDLGLQIQDTEKSITQTSSKITVSQENLGSILQTIRERDQSSLLEILLSEKEMSDFFDDLAAMESLSQKSQELLGEIKNLKTSLEGQKVSLDGEKDDLEKTVKIQTLQKQQNEANKKQQEQYQTLTEAQYQKLLAQKQDVEKRAAEIKSKLFQLAGVTEAPTFGQALEIAKAVSSLIDIRPAFLLAVISQESAIGRNVGQCLLTDATTGAGKRISTGASLAKVMKPTRDVQPFLKITAELGKDPYNTAVSCPLSIGYGGAMGPAQFIPSTWVLYVDKLKNVLGWTANPWAIKDSFAAAALYLSELQKKYGSEKTAAGRYYGDTTSYYSSQVMKRATCIQDFIDKGTMSDACETLIL